MKKIQLAVMAAVSVMAFQTYAVVIDPATISAGNSWDVTWDDGNYTGEYTKVVFTIINGGGGVNFPATFDGSASINSTTGSFTSTSSTVNYNGGPGDTTMMLSFTGDQFGTGYQNVQVSVQYYDGSTLLTSGGFNWEWLNLPADTGTTQGTDWQYLPVPDGGMTAGLLGSALIGLQIMRRKLS
jgi:hypothetical protein